MMPPLLRVRGVGKLGFWGVVNGLTKLDLGERCNEEWGRTLEMVKRNRRVIGPTPYSAVKVNISQLSKEPALLNNSPFPLIKPPRNRSNT
jgi:hypothetical protein